MDHRWPSALVLASLDEVRPWLVPMGLPEVLGEPERHRAFVEAVRTALVEFDEEGGSLEQRAAQRVGEACGEDVGRALAPWVMGTFYETHADLPHWSGWLIAFKLASEGTRHHNDLFGKAKSRTAAYAMLREHLDLSHVDNAIAGSPVPRTDWDVMMYAQHGFDDDNDPSTTAREVATMNQFQAFVRALVPRLSDDELVDLHLQARALLARLGVWMPEPLATLPELAGA